MIVHETYAVCEHCGFRVPGDEHPEDWFTLTQHGQSAAYCSRACFKSANLGNAPLRTRHPLGVNDIDKTIVELAARGLENKQIAEHVGRSRNTVKNRLILLYAEFGVHDRAHLVAVAHARGLIDCSQLVSIT